MAKPRGDLGALVVPKAAAAAAVPHTSSPPAVASPAPSAPLPAVAGRSLGRQVALTVKMDAEDYGALLRVCADEAAATGRKPTHMEVMVRAFRAYVASQGRS